MRKTKKHLGRKFSEVLNGKSFDEHVEIIGDPEEVRNTVVKEMLDEVDKRVVSASVNHPSHYGGKNDKFEHIKVAEAKGWDGDAYIYNLTRYIWRLEFKDGKITNLKDAQPVIQELKKALFYLQRRVSRLEK
jgi:5'(3')-deoxyribonucleotidase